MKKWQPRFSGNYIAHAHKSGIDIVASRRYQGGSFVIEYNLYGFVIWLSCAKAKRGYKFVSAHKTLAAAKQKCDRIERTGRVRFVDSRCYL
ncbi:MAG: hypothetical protein ACO3CH_00130 [Ilumatobacteraceae bacterium]